MTSADSLAGSTPGVWPSLPFLTAPDVRTEPEGSIDPLGLTPIAERLAAKLVPGVRERQRHPRFLTAMALGQRVCEGIPADAIAADDHSPPYQVFEWYAVEGFVRTAESRGEREAIRGLPGQDKARAALRLAVPLSAATYLKVPSVFGFHGVYRTLGEALGIIDDHGLRETGAELLETWVAEQQLEEALGGARPGPLVRNLRAAVQEGLSKGEAARGPRWRRWNFFLDHLAPLEGGPRERDVVWRALATPADNFRAQVCEFMASREGREALRTATGEDDISERTFHEHLKRFAGPDLRALLDAIAAYEHFCRLIHDAFYDCLAHSAEYSHPVDTGELAALDGVRTAAKQLRAAFEAACERLESQGETRTFRDTFGDLVESADPRDWVEALLDHHRTTQRRKAPDGKAPWFEQFTDGRIMTRPQYRERTADTHNGEYVGLYRTRPLQSMAADLGRLEP